jgi:hypothetical protein
MSSLYACLLEFSPSNFQYYSSVNHFKFVQYRQVEFGKHVTLVSALSCISRCKVISSGADVAWIQVLELATEAAMLLPLYLQFESWFSY